MAPIVQEPNRNTDANANANRATCKLVKDEKLPPSETSNLEQENNNKNSNDQQEGEDEALRPLIGPQRLKQNSSEKRRNIKTTQMTAAKSTATEDAEIERRLSQCSSSSQLACSLSSSVLGGPGSSYTRTTATNESRRSSSVCMGMDLQPGRAQRTASGLRNFLADKLSSRKTGSIVDSFDLEAATRPMGQNSRREQSGKRLLGSQPGSISQSMFGLDQQTRPGDTFVVGWQQLTYAYEPSWLARTARKLGQRVGLVAKDKDSRASAVLRNLSGSFKSNQLVAIIGPSGCGKTTLLQFLAGNNASHQPRMRIRGLSEPKVAYIGQHDSLLPGLTARETLLYASRLQNNRAGFNHEEHVKPIMRELGLLECADRRVTKLSGGQAKRVAIAQELLYPTNILILDEVTSGLDASTSYSIVKLLKYLVSDCSYPMSIVMSIHQPSARLFSVFDQVYVMSQGCCLYEGSCRLQEINSHLAQFQLECPKYHNIADYLIELACCTDDEPITYVTKRGADEAKTQIYSQNQESSGHTKELMVDFHRKRCYLQDEEEESLHHNENSLPPNPSGWTESSLYEAIERARSQRERPFLAHFRLHFRRSLLRISRSYILTYLQLATYIVLGLQISTFYGPDVGSMSGCPRLPSSLMSYVLVNGATSSSNNSTQQDQDEMALEMRRIQENMNFLLVTVMTTTFAALEITVITFPLEAKSIKREWRNGWYRVSSYFMGRTLADLPFQLVFVMVFCLLVYVMTGQIGLDTWRFGYFVAIIAMTALVAQAIGLMFGALFMDNLPAAVFSAPLAVFPALLFSGFFSRVSRIPAFYRPMTYLSHFRYAFDSLLVTLYGNDRCNCDQEHLTQYHISLKNQTSSMRDMISFLFGGPPTDCTTSAPPLEATTQSGLLLDQDRTGGGQVSHDDLAVIQSSNSSIAAQLIQTLTSTTMGPTSISNGLLDVQAKHAKFMKPLEDVLVESLFNQTNSTSLSNSLLEDSSSNSDESLMDRMANKFAQSLTKMLNKQANFGHPMPTECSDFNSYLLTEFSLHDDDLTWGLMMLFLAVLITRLLCNCILNFTIASRAE